MRLDLTSDQLYAVKLKAEGKTRAEVAAEMGTSKQAVKKLWARARARALADMPDWRRQMFVAASDVSARPRSVRARSLATV